jgi:Skp family chaperone for outer membrane proteins
VTKNTKKSLLFSMSCSTLCSALLSTTIYAADVENISIEVMSDAKVFAQLDDEIPAVVNYFTKKSETNIVAFYEEKYGQAISSDRKRGRLEKSFTQNNYNIKVIISEQNNQRQVDVLITK